MGVTHEHVDLIAVERTAEPRFWRLAFVALGFSDKHRDVFVHITAVERAGLSTLKEGQQVEYEIVSNRGKSSAENLKVK